MKKERGEKHGGGRMLKGLKTHSPSSSDKSTELKMSPSVNSGAERSGTAPTPQTLGPRTA